MAFLHTLRAGALLLVALATSGCIDKYKLTQWLVLTLCGVDGNDSIGVCPPSHGKTRAGESATVVPRADAFSFHGGTVDSRPNGRRTPIPVELVPPFRIEVTCGLCDAALAPDASASFGVAVRDGFDGTDWWSVACHSAGGLSVTPQFGTGTPISFPGVTRVDVAIEHDGTTLVAFVRDPRSTAPWQELTRETVSAPSGAYLPEAWARDFQPGAMSSVYAVKFVANGTPAAGASPQRQALRDVAEATTALLAASSALHDAGADATVAAARIEDVRTRIADALADLAAPQPGKATAEQKALAKARKTLTKTSKGLLKAANLLRKKGLAKADAADRQIAKAMKGLASAFDLVLPDDLRAAIGGLTLNDVLDR